MKFRFTLRPKKKEHTPKKDSKDKGFTPPKIRVSYTGAVYIDPEEVFSCPRVEDEETRKKIKEVLKIIREEEPKSSAK